MRRILVITAAATAAAGSSLAAAPGPAWKVYADCAAAYLANARLADPDRPAAMTAQVSDVANDYSAAAVARRRAQLGGSKAAAGRAVAARVAEKARAFAARPREAVEQVIDACPQIGGQG